MAHDYDRSSKWLIQHHGDSILRLAGIEDVESWRALQAELVQPRRLPDGLLEVRFKNDPDPDLFILEIATYPEARLSEQLADDLMLVYLNRRTMPEVVTLVLHPKGNAAADSEFELRSRRGLAGARFFWHVVEVWELPTERLLQLDELGLVPWIPLTQFSGPPEPILRKCREIIDRKALPDERANLLAVTQVLAGLRYNDPELFNILGGMPVMIESPVIERLVSERVQDSILSFLEGRFGAVPEDLANQLRTITDEERLRELAKAAGSCSDLDSLAEQIGKP